MASCSICGKQIGILDSTTSYYDENGNQVTVHTGCRNRQMTLHYAGTEIEMYEPVTEDPTPETKPKRSWWPLAGCGVVTLLAMLWDWS